MTFPTLPASGVQNALTPTSTSLAPSVTAVVDGLALKQDLLVSATNIKTINGVSVLGSGDMTIAGGEGGAVASVFGRTGAVVAATNDYTFAQIGSKPTTLAGYGIADAAPLVHVGTGGGQHANVVEGGASGFMTGAQATKLAGIATSATANSSDATLLARANHTGTQTASTIQDFDEAVQDVVGVMAVAGANVTLTYNDTNGTLTISSATIGGASLADGSYTDVSASSSGAVITINPGVVTLAKMANLSTDVIIGRDTAGTGVPEALTVTGGLQFTGSGGIQTSAFTGDVTKSAGGTALAIAANAVTYSKFQQIGTDTLVGRDTAGTGDAEAIALNTTLSMDGAGNLQRSALTGDVTAAAGSNATTIASSVVTLAKMANLAQDQFIGRVTASTGVPETTTITAAARSVLDDVSLDAMINTLGGATATGTGALVRATTPTLVTPVLGAATGTSIALGGGTALTTTNRTGTGNLVLNTDPTLTRAVLSGISTSDGAWVTTASAMGALAVDTSKALNTKTIATETTFTFSGAPATASTMFGLMVTNSDTVAHILTFPSSFDMSSQTTRTTCPIAASGKLFLNWNYNGSAYELYGASGYLNKYDAAAAPTANEDVADGYGPGSLWLDTSSNLAYICESNGAAAAVWNVLGGGVSNQDYGDITVAAGVWTIDAGVVTLAKLADIATDKLIGRDSAATGVPEAIGVTGGIEFDGTGNIRTTALTGDVTKTAGGTATTIANAAVTLAKMANLAQSTFIGRVTASTGVPEALTSAQATSILSVFTSGLNGVVPASGGGTANFLRADGSWASPAGAGTVTNTGGNLTANSLVLGAGVTDTKVVAGILTDGVSKITTGVAGVSVGGYLMANATSGTVEIRPVTGALGTSVLSAPATTGTIATVSGALGTPTSATLTNATGLPISTGVSGLGTGVATFLGTPSSANLRAALTDETGSGGAVFATDPTLNGAKTTVNAVPSSDNTYDGTAIVGRTAGATIAQWGAVYMGSGGSWLLADANGTGTYPAQGLATASYVNTNAATVLVHGVARNDAWAWTVGGRIYLSGDPTTNGGLTQTAPSTSGDKVQYMGYALSADSMYVDPSPEYITLT
jgi:hypothetical protein